MLQLRRSILDNELRELTGYDTGDANAVNALLEIARTAALPQRTRALLLLRELPLTEEQAEAALPSLLDNLASGNADFCRAATAALIVFAGAHPAATQKALPRLCDLLQEASPAQRTAAAHILAHMGERAAPATDILKSSLAHEDAAVRLGAALALASILGPEDTAPIPVLCGALEHSDSDKIFTVLETLHGYGAGAAACVEQVLPYAANGIPPVRWAAVRALGVMGGEAVRRSPNLLNLLTEQTRYPDATVRDASFQALEQLRSSAP